MPKAKHLEPCAAATPTTKRDCILAAAQTMFLEAGYVAVSMDTVAAQANVSKATIYAHFANKRALFEAFIEDRCEQAFATLDCPKRALDARQALYTLAKHFVELVIDPDALALFRVVVSEAPRLPEVGEAFYNTAPRRVLKVVTELFSDLSKRGLLNIPDQDIPLVSELFVSMLKGDRHIRGLLNIPADECNAEDVARMAVDLVLARYGNKP
jgi:TetR/AcrR family transcriptional repressor of mexJK operon